MLMTADPQQTHRRADCQYVHRVPVSSSMSENGAAPDALIACINAFTDILGSLERILTSPLPFSYSAHIWVVAWIYCLLLVS